MVFAPSLIFSEENVADFVARAARAIDLTYDELKQADLL
jgi:hypothetical protein